MRGRSSEIGATRIAANGYHYTKVERDGKGTWMLTHHIVAEEKLGRRLREDERVTFVDGKRSNLKADNIQVVEKGRGSVRRRKAQIEARIAELQAELDTINEELRGPVVTSRE